MFYPSYPLALKPEPLAFRSAWIAYTPYSFTNYYVDFKRYATFDAYLRSFLSKSRWTLQRNVRRFAEAGGGQLAWRRFCEPHEFDEFFTLAGRVSATTYPERLLHKGLPRSPEFIADTKRQAACGGVIGYILFLRGNAVAFEFCRCRNGIVSYDHGTCSRSSRTSES